MTWVGDTALGGRGPMHRLGDLVDRRVFENLELEDRRWDRVRPLARELASRGVPSDSPVSTFFVPGRIEILGKHTDYAGGRSLTAATNRGILLAGVPRTDRQIKMLDVVRQEEATFDLDEGLDLPKRGWATYPQTVARRFLKNVCQEFGGAEIVFSSDLPPAAGLSSSSALVVGTYLALWRASSDGPEPWIGNEVSSKLHLAAYLGAVENGRAFGQLAGGAGVGTLGGDQDHTAILCSAAGELRQFSYHPSRLEHVFTLPDDVVFAVAVSGVHSSKTGAAKDDYNRTSQRVGELLRIWNRHSSRAAGSLGEVVAGDTCAADRLLELVDNCELDDGEKGRLSDRLRQFCLESMEIVPQAGEALARSDLEAFGEWVDRSQEAGDRLLGNQVEETRCLASQARRLGALGASAFGAGYGGAVWAMVRHTDVDDFLRDWSAIYLSRFPEHSISSSFFWTPASGPATEL